MFDGKRKTVKFPRIFKKYSVFYFGISESDLLTAFDIKIELIQNGAHK